MIVWDSIVQQWNAARCVLIRHHAGNTINRFRIKVGKGHRATPFWFRILRTPYMYRLLIPHLQDLSVDSSCVQLMMTMTITYLHVAHSLLSCTLLELESVTRHEDKFGDAAWAPVSLCYAMQCTPYACHNVCSWAQWRDHLSHLSLVQLHYIYSVCF